MKFHRNCSASGMFVFNCVPSFMEMWRKYIYDFTQRLTNSDNAIVAATVSSCRMSSNFWKRWYCVLYTVHGVWILVVIYIQILWVQYHCVFATIVVYLHVYMGLQPCCLAWNKRFTYLLTFQNCISRATPNRQCFYFLTMQPTRASHDSATSHIYSHKCDHCVVNIVNHYQMKPWTSVFKLRPVDIRENDREWINDENRVSCSDISCSSCKLQACDGPSHRQPRHRGGKSGPSSPHHHHWHTSRQAAIYTSWLINDDHFYSLQIECNATPWYIKTCYFASELLAIKQRLYAHACMSTDKVWLFHFAVAYKYEHIRK